MERSRRETLLFLWHCIASLAVIISVSACGDLTPVANQGTDQNSTVPDPVEPITVDVDDVPSTVSESPEVQWTPDSDAPAGQSYEARVHQTEDDAAVSNWVTVNPGDRLTGLSLDPEKSYYILIRAVNSQGEASSTVRSPDWIPSSEDCIGARLTNSPYAAGAGTVADPFIICTPAQLVALQTRTADFNKSFKLGANLNLTGVTFDGIAFGGSFEGRFLGNNKTIKGLTITKASGDSVGLFSWLNYAYVADLTLEGPAISAANSAFVGALAGSVDRSTIANVTIINAAVTGLSEVGALAGYLFNSTARDLTLSGQVQGSLEVVGGILGASGNSAVLDAQSSVAVLAPTADVVGGAHGEDWSLTHFQKVAITGNVTGKNEVGGFVGLAADGIFINKSDYVGTITGTDHVGGFIGSAFDSPAEFESVSATASIVGRSDLGGFVGYNEYRTAFNDTFFTGSIAATGAGADAAGGLFGRTYDRSNVTNAYVNVTITGTAQRVGGGVGYAEYWSASGALDNVFVAANVAGSSEAATVSLFLGQIDFNSIVGANLTYWSGGSCTNAGGGGCNSLVPTAEPTLSDLYSSANLPLSNWNFTDIWQANAGAFPTLRQASPTAPTVAHSCAAEAAVNQLYTCTTTITDGDLNEDQFIVLTENHTCRWMWADSTYDWLLGQPSSSDVGSCVVSFRATDGFNVSAVAEFTLTVSTGVSVSPQSTIGGPYSFGFQHVATGALDRTFTITNTAAVPLTGFSVSGLATPEFAFKGGSYPGTGGTCGTDLAVSANCTVVVSFDPTVNGAINDSLIVTFNDGQSRTHTHSIQGTGFGL